MTRSGITLLTIRGTLYVIVLLLVMAGLGNALVESFGEQDVALSVILAAGLIGCGVSIWIIVRRVLGWWRIRQHLK